MPTDSYRRRPLASLLTIPSPRSKQPFSALCWGPSNHRVCVSGSQRINLLSRVRRYMDAYFARIRDMSLHSSLPNRVRFVSLQTHYQPCEAHMAHCQASQAAPFADERRCFKKLLSFVVASGKSARFDWPDLCLWALLTPQCFSRSQVDPALRAASAASASAGVPMPSGRTATGTATGAGTGSDRIQQGHGDGKIGCLFVLFRQREFLHNSPPPSVLYRPLFHGSSQRDDSRWPWWCRRPGS